MSADAVLAQRATARIVLRNGYAYFIAGDWRMDNEIVEYPEAMALRDRAVELSGNHELIAEQFGHVRAGVFIPEGWGIFVLKQSGPAHAPCSHAWAFGWTPVDAWRAFIKAWTAPHDCSACVHDVPTTQAPQGSQASQ